MNKAEIVARMARDTGLTKADTNRVLDAFIAQVGRALKKGGKVTLVGFGTFTVLRRRPRGGRNPRTGARIRIAGYKTPKFTAGKELRATVR
jgi:DNA-binding protein HU-beta